MGRTFRQMFEGLEPERRARIIFGMDKMHRRYLASRGSSSGMPYDVVEYLTDEATIEAYLAEVRRSDDADLIRQAHQDAYWARQRLKDDGYRGSHCPESTAAADKLASAQ